MKKILSFIILTVLCFSLIACDNVKIHEHEIVFDANTKYQVVDGIIQANCSICGEFIELNQEQLSYLDGKILLKKDDYYLLTDKSIKELISDAENSSSIEIVLTKGENYIISTDFPRTTTTEITLNITGLKDNDGKLLSSIQLDNSLNEETHCYNMSGLNLTVKDVILVGEDADANGDARHGAGFFAVNELLVENCIFKKSQCLWNYGKEYTIKNCSFIEPYDKAEDSTSYQMWTRGQGTWNFTDCKFISHGKAIKIYNSTGTVNVTNCTFEIDQKIQDKNAIEIDASITVNVTNCTQTGYKGIKTQPI